MKILQYPQIFQMYQQKPWNYQQSPIITQNKAPIKYYAH